MYRNGNLWFRQITADQIAEAVDGAIKSGYRMFDCAACYGNEPEIGKVFKNAFDEEMINVKISLL